jgi:hypothetical protein
MTYSTCSMINTHSRHLHVPVYKITKFVWVKWYSKAKQHILSAIYLVSEYCLTAQIKQIKVLP